MFELFLLTTAQPNISPSPAPDLLVRYEPPNVGGPQRTTGAGSRYDYRGSGRIDPASKLQGNEP